MIITDIITGKDYEISRHALNRAAMRGVREHHILETIRNPESHEWNDKHGTWNYISRVQPNGKRILLLLAVNADVFPAKIVTVIFLGE